MPPDPLEGAKDFPHHGMGHTDLHFLIAAGLTARHSSDCQMKTNKATFKADEDLHLNPILEGSEIPL